jgi:acetyl esterase
MINEESKRQLETRKTLNQNPLNTLSPIDARKQFNEAKEYSQQMSSMETEILIVENRKIEVNGTKINIRIFSDSKDNNLPLLVNFHGGGWVLGDLDSDESMCKLLSKKSGYKIISVDYRLAPENKFPIPLQDCYESLIYFYENSKEFGINPEKISICGTSAGGNLSAGVSLLLRDNNKDIVKSQILFCPVTDNDFNTETYNEYVEGFGLDKEAMIWFWNHYVDGDITRYAAPNKDTKNNNLPKTYIITAECDILRSEAEKYHENIKNNVDSKIEMFEGALHGFNVNVGEITNAEICLNKVSNFLND